MQSILFLFAIHSLNPFIFQEVEVEGLKSSSNSTTTSPKKAVLNIMNMSWVLSCPYLIDSSLINSDRRPLLVHEIT